MKEEIVGFDRAPQSIIKNIDERELSQLACDYINFKQTDKKLSREDLETFLGDCLTDIEGNIQSKTFQQLASLPFNFIVNTTYTNFFVNQFKSLNKSPETAYYNFKGDKVDLVNSITTDELGTELNPFIYNLFGSVDDAASLVISENDLVQFVINIISKNPGLPANVKSELANQDKCFLFIGFGFLAKNWYFRILLQALESNNKGRMSYALECINDIQNDEDPTVLFFRDELKVSLYYYNQQEFIDTLTTTYNAYAEKRKATGGDKVVLNDAPKAFISYKSEDFVFVNDVCQKLKQQGINAWLDRERLQGKWEPSIAAEITNSDAFILMQSQQVKNNPVNYVNVEIKQALDKARYFQPESDFIFPTYIDSTQSLLTDYPLLSQINSYNLSNPETIEQLAKDIKRSYERNKRKRAA